MPWSSSTGEMFQILQVAEDSQSKKIVIDGSVCLPTVV